MRPHPHSKEYHRPINTNPAAVTKSSSLPLHPSDLHGLSRLAVDGVIGVTDMVEHLHHAILRVPGLAEVSPDGRTRGITGFVYRSIHGVTGLVGGGLNLAFSQVIPRFKPGGSTPTREHLLAVINGVLGDHLHASDNPLAISMTLRRNGRPVAIGTTRDEALISVEPRSRLLVSAHGLCMHDGHWYASGTRAAEPAGGRRGLPERLGEALGYSVIDLHYNSGRHISDNGRDFAEALEHLVDGWPVPVDELVILGHSMGGLVARSAAHHALDVGHRWPEQLKKLVFLGTPHHGAPLERAGHGLDRALGFSRYSAPFSRIGKIRSAGITDLRHGNVIEQDWAGQDRFAAAHDTRSPARLPDHVECHAVAATASNAGATDIESLSSDGLVPVASALGHHPNPDFDLDLAPENTHIVHDTRHLGLLSSREVADKVGEWLGGSG